MDANAPVDETKTKTKNGKERREEQARLAAAIAAHRCVHCGSVGCYGRVENTEPIEGSEVKKRYLRCLACGKWNTVAV